MPDCTQLWIDRKDIRTTKQVTSALPALGAGEVLVAIDKFGLTANNVSYAVTGDSIGYWQSGDAAPWSNQAVAKYLWATVSGVIFPWPVMLS